jgi:hypothetical protein
VCVLLMLGCVATGPGCAEESAVRSDAETPPPDGGMDSTGGLDANGGNDMEDGGPSADGQVCVTKGPDVDAGDGSTADAAVDGSDDTSSACTPAACEAADGGADADPPPWGCPEACDPPCEGDTVCCDNGTCQQRALHGCEDGCDVELTIHLSLLCCCLPGHFSAIICNRGSTEHIDPGQLVRFEAGDETLCEVETSDAIAPCSCIRVTCTNTSAAFGDELEVRGTVHPSGFTADCGNPLGMTDTGAVMFCE